MESWANFLVTWSPASFDQVLSVADKRKPSWVLADNIFPLCGTAHARGGSCKRKGRPLCGWNPSKKLGYEDDSNIIIYIYYHHYYHILSLLWLLIIVIVIMMIIIIYTYTHECLLQTSSGGIAFIVYFFVYSVCLCPGAGSTLPLCRHRSNKTHEAQEKMVFTSVWGVALFVWRLQPSGMNLACP